MRSFFIEKASGKDFKRPEYQLIKRMFRQVKNFKKEQTQNDL
jgi:hypothetical protein